MVSSCLEDAFLEQVNQDAAKPEPNHLTFGIPFYEPDGIVRQRASPYMEMIAEPMSKMRKIKLHQKIKISIFYL